MLLSLQFARSLLLFQAVLLIVGTQMPGAWRSGIEASLNVPFGLSSLAHFVLFASMACVVHSAPLSWSLLRVISNSLLLAILTECLQFFAIDRNPRLLDVVIDMGGASFGLGLVCVLTKIFSVSVMHK